MNVETFLPIGQFDIWHFLIIWTQACVLSLILDRKSYKAGLNSLSKIAFSKVSVLNRYHHEQYWSCAAEITHKFVVYLICVTVGYLVTIAVFLLFQN